MCRTQAIPLLIDSTHFPLTSKLHNNGFEWESDYLLLVGSDIGPLKLPPLRQLFFLGTFYTFHKVAKYASGTFVGFDQVIKLACLASSQWDLPLFSDWGIIGRCRKSLVRVYYSFQLFYPIKTLLFVVFADLNLNL